MQVVQIGDVTTGKKCWVSHFTTPTLGTENRNPNHRYAMQPIVLKSSMQTVSDYFNGLKPDYALKEDYGI
jgi:hypothetical protein